MPWTWTIVWSHVLAALCGFGLGIAWALFLNRQIDAFLKDKEP